MLPPPLSVRRWLLFLLLVLVVAVSLLCAGARSHDPAHRWPVVGGKLPKIYEPQDGAAHDDEATQRTIRALCSEGDAR
jgi:hypothetical protein